MDDRELQSLLEETTARLGIVGAQLALYDGTRLREFAAGWRNRELELPVTTATLFQIGSTTKVFNAALIMTLVDEGRLDLDTPVAEYIPGFHLASFEAQTRVTLRQLLSMSGGLDSGSHHDYGAGDDALARYVAALAAMPQVFEPGTAFGYSNASSAVAGYAATCVMRQSWESLLTERILRPLGLGQSALFPEDLLGHPVALGYLQRGPGASLERVPRWGLPRALAPAGATLCSSAGDLVRFACMFLQDGTALNGTRVLSKGAVNTMHAPRIKVLTQLMAQDWCVGPYRKEWGGHEIYGHSGVNTGGSSELLWCPQKRIAIATTVNWPYQGLPLAEHIFDQVFPGLFGISKPKPPDPQQLRAPEALDLRLFTGRYEMLGGVAHVDLRGDRLFAAMDSDAMRRFGLASILESELIPLGGGRFFPRDPAFSGNRSWDVAFWDAAGAGRPTHFLNGMNALRRTG